MRYVARRLVERPRERRLALQLAAGASASTVVNSLERLGVASTPSSPATGMCSTC
jgi:hypothetical protein